MVYDYVVIILYETFKHRIVNSHVKLILETFELNSY